MTWSKRSSAPPISREPPSPSLPAGASRLRRRVGRSGGDALDDLVGGRRRGARPAPRPIGERPSWWVSSSVARRVRRCSSLAERGTRTVQVWSRKWRLISPSIVRPANVEKATSRCGSNRSTAFTSARKATWRRSSSLGPRRPKRRATWAARPRWRSTSWLRSLRSRVRANVSNSARSSSSAPPWATRRRRRDRARRSRRGGLAQSERGRSELVVVGDGGDDAARHVVGLDRSAGSVELAVHDDAAAAPTVNDTRTTAPSADLDQRRQQLVDAEAEVVEVVDAQPGLGPERGGDQAARRRGSAARPGTRDGRRPSKAGGTVPITASGRAGSWGGATACSLPSA